MPRLKPPAFSGTELGYAEITANQTPANTANQIIAVTGLSVTVTTALRPVVVEVFVPDLLHSVAGTDLAIQLYEDGSVINAGTVRMDTVTTRVMPRVISRRNPAAGSHTYDARVKAVNAGTITVEAGTVFPAWIQVREV